MVGNKYGQILVLKKIGVNKHRENIFEVLCDCGVIKESPLKHFISGRTQSCGCWLWTASNSKDGYGFFYHKKYMYQARRFSYERHSGSKIPDGLLALHKCDTPACVNPKHLFIGTHKDNALDKVKKGRSNKGKVYKR